jgi:hypothetical protein
MPYLDFSRPTSNESSFLSGSNNARGTPFTSSARYRNITDLPDQDGEYNYNDQMNGGEFCRTGYVPKDGSGNQPYQVFSGYEDLSPARYMDYVELEFRTFTDKSIITYMANRFAGIAASYTPFNFDLAEKVSGVAPGSFYTHAPLRIGLNDNGTYGFDCTEFPSEIAKRQYLYTHEMLGMNVFVGCNPTQGIGTSKWRVAWLHTRVYWTYARPGFFKKKVIIVLNQRKRRTV